MLPTKHVEISPTTVVQVPHEKRQQSRAGRSRGSSGLDSKSFLKFILYRAEEKTNWIFCFVSAMQYYAYLAYIVTNVLDLTKRYFCSPKESSYYYLIGGCFFIKGMVIFVQSVMGIRLPMASGPYIGQARVMLQAVNNQVNGPGNTQTCSQLSSMSRVDRQNRFLDMFGHYQGCIIICGILEIGMGVLGLVGVVLQHMSPLVIGANIMIIPFIAGKDVCLAMAENWIISLMTMSFLGFFSFVMGNLRLVVPFHSKSAGWHLRRYYFFQIFSFHLTLAIMLPVWYLVGLTLYPNSITEEEEPQARPIPDADDIWFKTPSPGYFGLPRFVGAGFLPSLIIALMENTFYSVGAYYNVAAAAGMPNPPVHAFNRAFAINGLSSVLGGMWGSLGGMVGFRPSAPYIAITRVAARRVGYCIGLMLILVALSPRMAMLVLDLPKPILASVACILYAMTAVQGLGYLKYVDLHCRRNQHIIGIVFILCLGVPEWISSDKEALASLSSLTQYPEVNMIITTTIQSSLMMSLILAYVLDLTVPGTDEERGMVMWREKNTVGETLEELVHYSPYALPIGMNSVLRNFQITSRLPVCPVFNPEISLLDVITVFCQVCAKKSKAADIMKKNRKANLSLGGDVGIEDVTA